MKELQIPLTVDVNEESYSQTLSSLLLDGYSITDSKIAKIFPDDYVGGRSCLPGVYTPLAVALRSNKTNLTTLEIASNVYFNYHIATEDLANILQALQTNKTVTKLTLRHLDMTKSVCFAFGKLLTVTNTLSKLSIFHCSFNDNMGLKTVIEGFHSNKSLAKVDINDRDRIPHRITDSIFYVVICSQDCWIGLAT